MVHTPLHTASRDSFADMVCTLVVLARGTTAFNEPCWSYVALKPSMALSFKEACAHSHIGLEDYGTILEEGLGAHPPADIRAKMARDFGVRQDLEDALHVVTRPHGSD